tara:strand:+ start:251 stop:538 length:288 start_codon:yes stop_codon:yes gene_type:complete
MERFLKYAPIPGAILAALTVWGVLGFPKPATSLDVQRLDKGQAEIASELYQNKVRSILITPKPSAEPNATLWQEELDSAKRQRDQAERRRIELTK